MKMQTVNILLPQSCWHLLSSYSGNHSTMEPVLSGHSKIVKTKVLKTGGSLMQFKSITECSEHSAILFDLH